MKKILLLVGILVLLSHSTIYAQHPVWLTAGNFLLPPAPPYIFGSLDAADVDHYTNGIWRARMTQDGNWDLGGNVFTLATNNTSGAFGTGNSMTGSTSSFATGTNNIIDNSNDCGAMGFNSIIKGATSTFALGRDHVLTVGGLDAIVALGARCQATNSNQSVLAGEDQQLTNGHGCFMGGGHNKATGAYNVTLGRGLQVNGNVSHAYGANIINNLSNTMIMGFQNNITMVLDARGVSIQTNPPLAVPPGHNLEVEALPSGGVASNIAFFNLPATTNNYPAVVIDLATGELFHKYLGGLSASCTTLDYVPKFDATGNLICSQIYDDGTSVGIGTTGPFGYVAGTFVVGTTPLPGTLMTLDVNGLARATTLVITSDGKFKKDVTPLQNSLDKILQLNPVSYNWKKSEFPEKRFDELTHMGFIAQELEKVLPTSVIIDDKGNYAVDYLSIIPVLTQGMQEQQKRIEKLEALNKKQAEELKALTQKVSGSNPSDNNGMETTKGGFLAQNIPNPFSVSTEIKYQLPQGTQQAAIGVYDMNGTEIRLFPLRSELSGSVVIQGGELKPGMYLYTLIIDGNAFDTKKMILTSH